jgi:integrase
MKWNGIEPEQASAVLQVSRGVFPEGTATLFGLLMGLRRAEIAAVDWVKFNPDLSWYEVHGKGNMIADIPVHSIVREEIDGRQTAFRYLFPGSRTAHVGPATIGTWVTAIGEVAGVPDLTPHKLRHTFISDVNDTSGDLRVAQELARHASPETTAGYTRVSRKRMVAASASLSYASARAVVNG